MDFLFCIAGATFSGLAFIIEPLWFLLLFAPGLYFHSLINEKSAFAKGFIFGFIFYMFNSLFLSSLDISHITDNLFMRKFIPFIAYVTVCLAEGIFSGVFARVFIYIKKRVPESSLPLVFSSLWVIYEALLGLSFSDLGYPFARIAIPFAGKPYLIQTASLFGILLISFLIIYFASSSAMSLACKSVKYMYIPLVLLTLNTIFSVILYQEEKTGETISVKCVQSGYGGYEKWVTPPIEIIKNSLSEFSGADVVLFSESTIPLTLNKTNYIPMISEEADKNNVTVLIGALYRNDDEKTYTSLYHVPYKEGEIYHKRHPVPFGEYYPLLDIFIKDLKEAGLSKGKEATPLSKYLIGPIVCFDSMFPSYAIENVIKGSRILCVSTNDSWFSKGNAAKLHLYHSVYRAIENGRYVARSACTGISSVIDSKGNIKSSIPFNETGSITEEVLLLDEKTPYTILGDLPMLIYAFSAIAISLIRRKYER